mmetsp:Transcript_8434/g.22556  ORF Transcript_8434/g.22556 Transcript_8434/m.22556 type:complete len:89 (+) Transcript_8434:1461-1727(+)
MSVNQWARLLDCERPEEGEAQKQQANAPLQQAGRMNVHDRSGRRKTLKIGSRLSATYLPQTHLETHMRKNGVEQRAHTHTHIHTHPRP